MNKKFAIDDLLPPDGFQICNGLCVSYRLFYAIASLFASKGPIGSRFPKRSGSLDQRFVVAVAAGIGRVDKIGAHLEGMAQGVERIANLSPALVPLETHGAAAHSRNRRPPASQFVLWYHLALL
jgi:hypothetical protein